MGDLLLYIIKWGALTHFTNTSSSTTDFGIFNGFNFDKSVQSVSKFSSDHYPILLRLQTHLPLEPPKLLLELI